MRKSGKREFATIRDVARAAGVSIATVSATINGTAFVSAALRARVLEAVQTTGYAPDGVARSLKRGVTPLIGLVVSDITIPFFGSLARAAEAAALARGHTILMGNSDEDETTERTYLDAMRTQRAAGIILSPAGRRESGYAEALRAAIAVPAVLIDRSLPELGWDTVVADHVGSAYAAVGHVAGLGHRRIGFIGGSLRLSTNRERLEGYRRALAEAGIVEDPALLRLENSHAEQAHAAALDLLGGPQRPSAVLLANIKITAAVLRALSDLGLRCPEDISIAAIDDFPWASLFRPRLTVIAQPAEEIGATAVRLLLERLAQPDLPPRTVVLPGRLIVRSSCTPPGDRA